MGLDSRPLVVGGRVDGEGCLKPLLITAAWLPPASRTLRVESGVRRSIAHTFRQALVHLSIAPFCYARYPYYLSITIYFSRYNQIVLAFKPLR